MYTITFYSFKGGVGRTFALVNVGAELARMGRRVLLVDFDLEAPGLETFERLRPPQPHAGVVEYVAEYLRTKQTPDVRRFVYSAGTVGKQNGELWVMPAGQRDVKYQAGLVSIDWKRLYRDCNGFEFFQETKKQWEDAYNPDYVLIDSRTGHTDVEGICTRQLPDAVVVLFFPNEQNLAGLRDVCRRIRSEKERRGLKQPIRLHFVMSNVPDLDDEDGILHHRLEAFHTELGIQQLAAVIHRYESVMLFNQAIFVLDRPSSRLSLEYQQLTEELITANPADRDGALLALRRYAQSYLPSGARRDVSDQVNSRLGVQEPSWYESDDLSSPPSEADTLDRIAEHFLDDADLLMKIAECRILQHKFSMAVIVLNRALQVQPGHPQCLLLRARCERQLSDKRGAADDLCNLLRLHDLEHDTILSAIRELLMVAPERLPEVADLPAVRGFNGDIRDLCDLLADQPEGLPHAIRLMRGYLAQDSSGDRPNPAVLHSYLLRAGQWQEVIEALEGKGMAALGPGELFELAMAYWGKTGQLPAHLCRLALERDNGHRFLSARDKAVLGALGADQGRGWPLFQAHYGADWLLLWGIGKGPEVLPRLTEAVEKVKEGRQRPFSIWRFREVTPDEFLEDCQHFRRMIQGEPIRPAFFAEPGSQDASAAAEKR